MENLLCYMLGSQNSHQKGEKAGDGADKAETCLSGSMVGVR